MNYEQMSDFEINNVVHNLVNGMKYSLQFLGCDRIKWSKAGEPDIFTGKCDYTKNGLHDYCNNPSDAMQILIENKIGFKWVNKSCTASSVTKGYHEFSDDNPLRAAMIVFLMMNEENLNGNN